LIEESDYYMFEGALSPARMRVYWNAKLHMEIEQKLTLVEGEIDWTALAPQNPVTYKWWQKYQKPLMQSAPQPPSAGAGPWYDVKVQANINADGHVEDAKVIAAGRPDLEQQAIQIVSKWVFTPAMCDGQPAPALADLTVHFPPQ